MNELTLRQISELTKLPMNTLKSRVRRECWPAAAETIINHRPARLFDPAALPEDLRIKLQPTMESKPSVALQKTETPEEARKIAVARFDLLRHWQDFRRTHEGKAAQADAEFLKAFNSGNLFNTLHVALGNVSAKTLYRWQYMLGDTQDWMRLVPAYYGRGRGGQPLLNQIERDIFMGLLLQPNRLSIGSAVRIVKFALEKQGQPIEHSPATFRRYAEHFQRNHMDRWVLLRDGQKALRDKVEPFIRRDPSLLEVGDAFVSDGHRLDFQVINPFTGKPCRATLIGYLDWKSYYLAGYYIMIEENTQCIAAALRGAILNLGKMPKVCYQDNGRAFRSRFFLGDTRFDECGLDGLFSRLGICPVFAHPYNARAKVIEGWWHMFSDTFERLVPSFTGTSIMDKPAWTSRNEKWHKVRHDNYIPTITEAIDMIAQWLDFAGSQECPHVKGKSCKQVFDEGKGPGVDPEQLDDLMMQEKVGYIGRHGIRFLGADYWSDELYGLKQRALVRYSLLDLGVVKVYTERGEFLCTAGKVGTVHPMARLAGAESEAEVAKILAAHQRLERRTMSIAELELGRIGSPFVRPHMQQQPQLAAPTTKTEKPVELHIPEGAFNQPQKPAPSAPSADGRPLFKTGYDRYQWHMEHGCKDAVDTAWLDAYKQSQEYQMLFAANEA
jgi:putative transposase